ncbi:MAG: hypothetical protein DRI84_05000 [Bacteroidetes bacterium]|nr:MAG: hypothetical protein DRI84_05000 [Bacteroidota bacterium]
MDNEILLSDRVDFCIDEFEKCIEPKEDLYVDSTTQSGIFKIFNGDEYTYQFDTDLFIRKVL